MSVRQIVKEIEKYIKMGNNGKLDLISSDKDYVWGYIDGLGAAIDIIYEVEKE